MYIYIDCREATLYNGCLSQIDQYNSETQNQIQIIQKQLPIGDIIICSDDGKEQVIIERKTLADMASSILDGRYKEQSMRLNSCGVNNHNIIYLIEGVMNNYFSTRLERKSLLSSLVSIMYFKGFSVYKTNNIQESAEWIVQLACKLTKSQNNPPFFKNEHDDTVTGGESDAKDSIDLGGTTSDLPHSTNTAKYSSVIKRVKKENITTDNIGEIMLSQIPGVSVLNAQTIMNQFKTIRHLMSELTEKGESVLSGIKQNNRKISKTSVSNIYKYLILSK
jgi:ERCC4-type nuclease